MTSRKADRNFSIHALLAESDAHDTYVVMEATIFYPRSPCGERLKGVAGQDLYYIFSIHALLAESDLSHFRTLRGLLAFSIHALLAESDQYSHTSSGTHTAFLSTLSLRRATFSLFTGLLVALFFYPRSPCGERLFAIIKALIFQGFSIHALLAESDFGGGE